MSSFEVPREGIFISYRRGDDPHAAARLRDGAVSRFGKDRVFFDVGLAPGLDYIDAIEEALDSCAVLFAVIGPRWADIADKQGKRRLDEPTDLVVREIATALHNGVRVVPVLLDGTEMPTSSDLPAKLRPLVRRNAATVRHDTFESDLGKLLTSLEPHLRNRELPATQPGGAKPSRTAEMIIRQTTELVPGSAAFRSTIPDDPPARRELLLRLTEWAEQLAQEQLVAPATFYGKTRTTLLLRIDGKSGLVTVYNDAKTAYLQFSRSVFERFAPDSIPVVESLIRSRVGQGTTTRDVSPELLDALTQAYREAAT
ncbi:toll/interleukin-1 receptor domain-containing protein [Saccharopolyspora elongata]|uniref:Toll/interleukin-1 receptor domain-containing protein n=1 Tax=Saccharopolyspora elongata TaxID=2530387 RepID=A0A4R4XYS4_9PSEU|nr:toll/interleukin-1 receptor domain-containing protein [Saccharopolyspora elongata]TDD37051.1 toll/interleukin-1 receptor domain-containing protein [Saccharopolyspora elongata]